MNHDGVTHGTDDDDVTTAQSVSDDSWQQLDEDIELVHLQVDTVDHGQQDMTDAYGSGDSDDSWQLLDEDIELVHLPVDTVDHGGVGGVHPP